MRRALVLLGLLAACRHDPRDTRVRELVHAVCGGSIQESDNPYDAPIVTATGCGWNDTSVPGRRETAEMGHVIDGHKLAYLELHVAATPADQDALRERASAATAPILDDAQRAALAAAMRDATPRPVVAGDVKIIASTAISSDGCIVHVRLEFPDDPANDPSRGGF